MIYGCDVGIRRLALSRPATGFVACLRLKGRGAADPVADIPILSSWLAQNVDPDALLVLEHMYVGNNLNMGTAIKLAMIAGAVISSHTPGQSMQVAQSTWKKAVIGTGRADKPAIRDWLAAEHPALAASCEDDQDLFDATCLGIYGHLFTETALEAPRAVPRRRPRSVLRSRGKAADATRPGRASPPLVQ